MKNTRIIIRGDAGFCRDELMSWCERSGVDYVLGMGRTSRLIKRVKKQVRKAQVDHVEKWTPMLGQFFRFLKCIPTISKPLLIIHEADHSKPDPVLFMKAWIKRKN